MSIFISAKDTATLCVQLFLDQITPSSCISDTLKPFKTFAVVYYQV